MEVGGSGGGGGGGGMIPAVVYALDLWTCQGAEP